MKGLFQINKKSAMGDDTKYSRAIRTPQYTPSNIPPPIEALVDPTKYRELLKDIMQSNVDEQQKLFLKLAAARHLVFNYAQIADYYAHTTPEMQRLMEKSALVILDIDDAIHNGYVNLSKRMEELVAESKNRRLMNG